jgi:hypothetical protein
MATIKDGTFRVTKDDTLTPALDRSIGYWVASTSNKAQDVLEADEIVDHLINRGANYIGIWTSGDGTIYVDKTHYFEEYEPAMVAAKHWNQEAIWDIANKKEEYVI